MQHDLIESRVFTNVYTPQLLLQGDYKIFVLFCFFVFFKEIILFMFTGHLGFYRFRALGLIQFFLEHSLVIESYTEFSRIYTTSTEN